MGKTFGFIFFLLGYSVALYYVLTRIPMSFGLIFGVGLSIIFVIIFGASGFFKKYFR